MVVDREKRKAVGLCTQCGAPLDRKGRECKRCNSMNNVSKYIYHSRIHEEGKCTQCLKPLDREGWFCIDCTKKFRLGNRERCAERRSKGLCVQCGKSTNGLGSYCRRCLDMRMDYYWRKKRRKSPG